MKINMQQFLYEFNKAFMTEKDVAVLSDWADKMQKGMFPQARYTDEEATKMYNRAFALIREGCDLYLRYRARYKPEEGYCPTCDARNSNLKGDIPSTENPKYWMPWKLGTGYNDWPSKKCDDPYHIAQANN